MNAVSPADAQSGERAAHVMWCESAFCSLSEPGQETTGSLFCGLKREKCQWSREGAARLRCQEAEQAFPLCAV